MTTSSLQGGGRGHQFCFCSLGFIWTSHWGTVDRFSPKRHNTQRTITGTQTETISISEPDLFLVVNSLFYLHFDTFVSQEPSEKNLLMEVCLSFSSIPPSDLQSSRSCRRPPPQRFGSKAQIFFYYNFYFLDLRHLVPKRTRVQSSEY